MFLSNKHAVTIIYRTGLKIKVGLDLHVVCGY